MNDAEWLRTTREALALTQAALAAVVGITQEAVSMMEAGRRPVTPRTRKQVEALVVSRGTAPPNPSPG